jgi:hypothetical protein
MKQLLIKYAFLSLCTVSAVGCGENNTAIVLSKEDRAMSNCLYQVSRGGEVSAGAVAECRKYAQGIKD